jgi:hypothetical protein
MIVAKDHLDMHSRECLGLFGVALAIALLAGCVTPGQMMLAPGADAVRITKNSADVSGCVPVGTVDSRPELDSEVYMRNHTVGHNGDTLLVTYDPADQGGRLANGVILTGVEYRCAKP